MGSQGVAPDRDARSSDSVLRTVDGFERTFGVNHLGHFALVKLLTPALVASASPRRNNSSNKGVGAARVVITSSSIHSAENPDGRAGGPATLGSLAGSRLSPLPFYAHFIDYASVRNFAARQPYSRDSANLDPKP
jgi:NAD(P)-dependent dehydrogenase (short-subunit alcohol dehydrogenase family)